MKRKSATLSRATVMQPKRLPKLRVAARRAASADAPHASAPPRVGRGKNFRLRIVNL
jgi:hypothetical protein